MEERGKGEERGEGGGEGGRGRGNSAGLTSNFKNFLHFSSSLWKDFHQ